MFLVRLAMAKLFTVKFKFMRLLNIFFVLAIIGFAYIGLSIDKPTISQNVILIYLISVCSFGLIINYKFHK